MTASKLTFKGKLSLEIAACNGLQSFPFNSCSSTLHCLFSNSLIIHKKLKLMSVLRSDEKLLIFASLISPSKIVLFRKLFQAFDTVFHHQMRHLEVRQNYSAARCRVFSTLFSVFHLLIKHRVSCLIHYFLYRIRKPLKGEINPKYLTLSKAKDSTEVHWYNKLLSLLNGRPLCS